jgi:hypothetical protein
MPYTADVRCDMARRKRERDDDTAARSEPHALSPLYRLYSITISVFADISTITTVTTIVVAVRMIFIIVLVVVIVVVVAAAACDWQRPRQGQQSG